MTPTASQLRSPGPDARTRRGVPSMDIPASLPRPEVARLVPLEVALELRAVPLAAEDGVLTVAIAEPHQREAIEALTEVSGYEVFPVWAPPDQLEAALQRLRVLLDADSPLSDETKPKV
jgi:hypothetical protein